VSLFWCSMHGFTSNNKTSNNKNHNLLYSWFSREDFNFVFWAIHNAKICNIFSLHLSFGFKFLKKCWIVMLTFGNKVGA